MAKPHITIRAETRLDKTITIIGVVKGNPTSVTIELPAAADPAGAISRPQASVVLTGTGDFAHAFTACPYGFYAAPKIVATNADGETVVHGWPIQLFAPGTAPIGTPRALLPPFVAPAFTAASVAVGEVVTDIIVESRSATDQTNVPFTIGHAFKQGDLAPGDFLVGRIAGQPDIPLQLNFKASHPNGSIRHAIISGVLPSLAAGTSKTVQLVRAASGTSTVAVPSKSITDAGFKASMVITVGGVDYTADATAALAAGIAPSKAWFGGAIATDYIVNLPFTAADGAQHADLTAQFSVRYYPGTGKARVDVVIEHTKAYTAIYDVTYTGKVFINGASVFAITDANGNALVHYPGSRWRRSFWWNQAAPPHIKHNREYMIGSRQIPNYDLRVIPSESTLAGYPAVLEQPSFALMGEGEFFRGFSATGGRPDIGLVPSWYAMYIISQDKRAKDMMLALANCGGSWWIHRRDTSNGPAAGLPIDAVHYPKITILGVAGDSKNSATGQYERLPNHQSSTPMGPDSSHQPAFSYIPYLVTGDHYHLEELQFWNGYNINQYNPGTAYRNSDKGLVKSGQVRGQAWNIRTLAETAAITPDDHPQKPIFHYWMYNNLQWYNSNYTDNPDANKLGIVTHGISVIYNFAGEDDAIGTFQQDFFGQAFGHAGELGFTEARRYLAWMSKFYVGRMIAPGYCWIDACPYEFRVRETNTSPFYETLADCLKNTISPAVYALPCNSPERLAQWKLETGDTELRLSEMRGRDSATLGYPANYQPALAMAVDTGAYPDGDLAWDLFDSRPYKPTYASQPQFAIVSRGVSAAPPVDPVDPVDPTDPTDPVDPPDPDPLPFDVYVEVTVNIMFIGKAAS